MKKFQSFNDIEDYLSKEEVPYKDNKEEILRKIECSTVKPGFKYKKLAFVSLVLLALVITVAFTYGYIREHESFVKAHDANIIATLADNNGNIVVQLGIMDEDEKGKNSFEETTPRLSTSQEFEDVVQDLEDNLPNDKIGVFVPVKGRKYLYYFDVLNYDDKYDNLEDLKKNISDDSPIPKYIPKRFRFEEASVVYNINDSLSIDLNKLFEEAKASGMDYIYREFERSNEVESYSIKYRSTSGFYGMSVYFKKGKTTLIAETSKLYTETIEYNGRKCLKSGDSYYTYIYIDDELWTIEFMKPNIVVIEEIFKMIESIDEANN